LNDIAGLKKRWKIYVIQHSHTDIGYTGRQEIVEAAHVSYIKQVLEILKDINTGAKKEWTGFKWTCETFWPVERFLENSTQEERNSFTEAVQKGDIGLSASYLNFTELINGDVLESMTRRAVSYIEGIGAKADTAMTADINGYSWGYAQCMADLGIVNLLSCVHAHHGMFPIGRKQYPFRWITPGGQEILVWNGEHYHFGNALGLVPGALGSYLIKDGYDAGYFEPDHDDIAKDRIVSYLGQLETEGYPYDFIPMTVSGLLIDNSPPNAGIMDFINKWNRGFGSKICMEMTTPGSFFSLLREQGTDIPDYSGDWPDWWADGVSSTPAATKFFRDAQRKYGMIRQLDPELRIISKDQIKEIEYDLAMFAEHTWGHNMSVVKPWDHDVQAQELRKMLFSFKSQDLVYRGLDRIRAALGEKVLSADRSTVYKVINPYRYAVTDLAVLVLYNWDLSYLENSFEVFDIKTGRTLPHQLCRHDEIMSDVHVPVSLDAGEQRLYGIRHIKKEYAAAVESRQGAGIDRVPDITGLWDPVKRNGVISNADSIGSEYVLIRWKENEGIVSWTDKTSGKELLRKDRKHNAFTPVYEITPFNGGGIRETRVGMGRNRKGIGVKRYAGRLDKITILENGPLFARAELGYELEGINSCSIVITVYAGIPRADVSVRINKNDRSEPENVYISLPFTAGEGNGQQFWAEKTGQVLRPRVDQLPGTCTDFYCVQEGVAYTSDGYGTYIAVPDAPLIQLGPLGYGQRQLMGHEGIEDDGGHLYSWIMNNYWETNFKGSIGGFFEFGYSVGWGREFCDPGTAIEKCRFLNNGLMGFRI
jgi:hypothetical protein